MRNYTPYEEMLIDIWYRSAMRALRRSLLLAAVTVAALLLFSSCGSSRKASSATVDLVEKDSARNEYSLLSGSDIRLTDIVKTDYGIRFEWKRYDTTKPPGSDGKPPLLEEGSGELNYTSSDSLAVAGNDSTKIAASEEKGKEVSMAVQSSSESEREDTGIFSDMADMLGALTISVVAIFIVGLLRKRLSKS